MFTSCIKRGGGGMLASALGASALLLGLGFSNNALAAQAGGAISLIAASPNLTEGQIFNVQVRITNTSSEDLNPPGNGDPIAATYTAGGAINIILACTDSANCATTQLPGTLQFQSCPTAQPGVTCAANGTNGVTISVGAPGVSIPAGGFVNIATMQLKAVIPVASSNGAPPVLGQFFQSASTGPNDIAAFSPIEGVTVTGGAIGSRNFVFPPVCTVKLDKQISCDGGTTWADAGENGAPLFNDGVATPCSATDPTLIKVRYIVKNPSTTLSISQCTLTESNLAFDSDGIVQTDIALDPTGQVIINDTLTPQCLAALPGEPDTATVTCNLCQGVTPTSPLTDSDQANLVCQPVIGLLVDRNVDCGALGANNTGGTADQTLTEFNGDGTNGCRAFNGSTVNWTYVAQNTSTRTLYDCTFVDTSTIVGGSSTPYVIGNLAPGATVSVTSTQIPRLQQTCTADLQSSETPNNGNLQLACCTSDVTDITACADADRVQRNDISTVTCLAPGVNVSKVCQDTNGDGRDDKVVVTTENTGQVDLTSCTVADAIYLNDPTCPPTGTPTPVTPIVPDQITNLAPGASVNSEGTLSMTLNANACNKATVNCTAANGQTLPEQFAYAVCTGKPPSQGCLTRTPGFWATHPAVINRDWDPNTAGIQSLLPISICGVTLDTTDATAWTPPPGTKGQDKKPPCDYTGHSTSEAMCSVGTDGQQCLTPNLVQLVRQCTAATLNVEASQKLGGNCDADYPGINDLLAHCCSGDSICTKGGDIGSCITALDFFNNSYDTLNFGFNTGSADPTSCQNAKNNGVVVNPR